MPNNWHIISAKNVENLYNYEPIAVFLKEADFPAEDSSDEEVEHEQRESKAQSEDEMDLDISRD